MFSERNEIKYPDEQMKTIIIVVFQNANLTY